MAGGEQDQQVFDNNAVMEPHLLMSPAIEGNKPVRNIYLRTYELVAANSWRAKKPDEWPLIATILQDHIVLWPIHVNPHAQRYLSPKNGQFKAVIWVDEDMHVIPNDVDEVPYHLESRLPSRSFDPVESGLGLNKDLAAVWQGLSRIHDADVLIISDDPLLQAKQGAVSISHSELDQLRRDFNRVSKNGRDLIRRTKQRIVHDNILTRLDPERFQRIVEVSPPLVEVRREGSRQAEHRERAERRSKVQSVRKQLDVLATEEPQELMKLHAEIELVTLSKMIEVLRDKLDKNNLPEAHWQSFFERNKLVLSMAFARPVQLLQPQFHAKGSTLTRTGAQIGDFLMREAGQALAIVEIKTPTTTLLQGIAYRGKEVFGPSSELSGAVTQVLFQQSELRQRWMTHVHDTDSLKSSNADAIKCVVIAGLLPADPVKLRSFEVFRNACKDVDVITFDELLLKLEFLMKALTPEPEDIPF